MKTPSLRRETERRHLANFMKAFEFFPQGIPIFDDTPDLIVHTGDHILGVEHTEVFRLQDSEVKIQGQEKYQNSIITKAQQIYEEKNDSIFYLNVLFDPNFVLERRSIEKVANQLANFVSQLNFKVGEGGWIHGTTNSWEFPPGIKDIYIQRIDQLGLSLWAIGRVSTVPKLTVTQIQNCLNMKEAKLGSYRSKCNKVWLLLVTDKGKPSSSFEFPNGIFNHKYHSGFDRVFPLDMFLHRVTELTVHS